MANGIMHLFPRYNQLEQKLTEWKTLISPQLTFKMRLNRVEHAKSIYLHKSFCNQHLFKVFQSQHEPHFALGEKHLY